MTLDDAASVLAASGDDRSAYDYTTVPWDHTSAERYLEALIDARDARECYPFAICDARSGEVVGMTRYLSLRWWYDRDVPDALEIGGTWLSPRVQRSGVNTEAKWLLLSHAFEEWDVRRVDLKSDARNLRSRRAIERLGATFEGVLRSWQPSQVRGEESTPRDTAMFSILRGEWPSVRSQLEDLRRRGAATTLRDSSIL